MKDGQECSATTDIKHPALKNLNEDTKLPTTMDWRLRNVVSDVKD